MKVELDDIRLAKSPFNDTIYVGVLDKKKEIATLWKHKKDITSDFISAAIARWENQKEVISSGNNKWEITIKKLK